MMDFEALALAGLFFVILLVFVAAMIIIGMGLSL